MAFVIAPQMYENGASQMPGLNTMANAYQQNTTQLGPSLLAYLASMQNHQDSLVMQQQQLDSLNQYRGGQLEAKDATLKLMEQQKLNNLLAGLGNVQGQIGQREQARATGIAAMKAKPEVRSGLVKSIPHQTMLPWDWGKPKMTDDALTQAAAAQYDLANPGTGVTGMQNTANQLQALINQQLGASMLPAQQGGAAPVIYTHPSGKTYTRNPDGSVNWLS